MDLNFLKASPLCGHGHFSYQSPFRFIDQATWKEILVNNKFYRSLGWKDLVFIIIFIIAADG